MQEQLTRRRFLAIGAAFGISSLVAACAAPTPATPTTAPIAATPTTPAAQATTAPAQQAAPTAASAPAQQPSASPTAAAAAQPTTAAQPTVAAQPKTTTQAQLFFWGAHSGAPEVQAYKDMAAEFTKLNPNITFSMVQGGSGQQNFNEVLLARIAAGNPPDVTVVWDSPVSLGARGSLVAVDDLMKTAKYSSKENWPTAVLASCVWAGKTYGFPTMSASYGMFYNEGWFERVGLPGASSSFPKTWDEMRQTSKKFTKWNGDTLETAGYIPFDRNWGAELLPAWVGSNGSKTFDSDNRKYTIDAEANVATLDYFLSWMDEEFKGDITKIRRSGAWGMSPSKEGQPPAWQNERVAMLMDGSWQITSMYNEVPPKFEKWNFAPIPIGPAGTKPVGAFWPNWFAIPQGTKAREAAFEFIDWLNGDGIRIWYHNVADLPANKKFPRDLLPETLVKKRGAEFAKRALDFFYGQFETSVPMWTSPVEDFSVDQLTRALERVTAKAAKPKDALAEAQKASQAELEKVLKANPG